MSRLTLDDVKWGKFKLKDIFEIENCKCSKVSNLKQGNIPYVGATNRNNGILAFVESNPALITKGNCIAFICDGEGSIGYSVYKKENFVGSTTVKVGRNSKLNKFSGLFITTIADTVSSKYNFGYKRNDTHLKAELLQLPIDSNHEPNWQFMESYIKQEQKVQIQKIKKYYETKFNNLSKENIELGEVDWKEFWLEDICSIKSGVRLTKADMVDGKRPFIGATEFENGITNFVDNINNSLGSNILGVNYNGSVVKNFYHEYECIFSDDVKQLEIKDVSQRNKYNYLFIKQMILQQETKYTYGYKFNASRMERQKIMLPVTGVGEIAWQYMSNKMKLHELELIGKVLKYL